MEIQSIAQIGDNLPPSPPEKTLYQYALEIRELLHKYDATQEDQKIRALYVGKLILEIKEKYYPDIVGSMRAGQTLRQRQVASAEFQNWLFENVKRKDGTPYAYKSLCKFMYAARSSDNYKKCLERDNENSVRVRSESKKYREIVRALPAVESLATKNALALDQQVNFLMTAWDTAENAARKQFMSIAGLKYEQH